MTSTVIAHTVVAVVLVGAAVALAITGHDAAPAWAALGGYAGGAAVQNVTKPSA